MRGRQAYVWAAIVLLAAPPTRSDGGGDPDGALDASSSADAESDTPEAGDGGGLEDARAGDSRTAALKALVTGTLDLAVEPAALFDIDLSDPAAVQVEVTRLRALLASAAEAARPPLPSPRRRGGPPPDAGTVLDEIRGLDPARWSERLELDRATLEFLSLPAERRAALLAAHAERQAAARALETEAARRAREAAERAREEERRTQAAEAERRLALEAARAARTEAERLVGEELARLIAIESRVAAVREDLRAGHERIAERRDAVLGWQRRARDARGADVADADEVYDALRRALRTARDELAGTLDTLGDATTAVPEVGPDALADVPAEIATEHVRDRRHQVERAIREAKQDERALREERASALLDEITALNRERLGLLAHLSSERRDAVTGFTLAGLDQARSEARHLSLVLRQHQHAGLAWVAKVRAGGAARLSAWGATAWAVPMLLLVAGFVWGRRRTRLALAFVDARIAEADRAERRTAPSPLRRMVRVLVEVHRPVEWLLLLAAALWLLPDGASDVLEVELVSAVLGWVFAGALIVNLVNALASGVAQPLPRGHEATAELRLRSLRLVGRTVVVFALILELSAELVGEGTIHSWVFSTCWFAAVPIFLVLVRWWRGTVFDRIDRVRKKTRLEAWVLASRSGWKSFFAAMVGALHLFTTGTLKTARGWISGFDVARRVHAYLFKREIDRLGADRARGELAPLDAEALLALHPAARVERWIEVPADEVRAAIEARVTGLRGGLIAVVGPRGMGKSSLLESLAARSPGATRLGCTPTLAAADVAGLISSRAPLVLLDDAHTLIRPSIGGFALFDEVAGLARAACREAVWVFAFDASLWPLLERARDARPLFDETHVLPPWSEAQIGALVGERAARAGLAPSFEDLLEPLPPGADEIDRQDALRAKQAGYTRMIWDHVGGNPGLALEAWRSSLGRGPDGVRVRALVVRDLSALEALPDASLFVLRAVLQLAPASVERIADATRLPPDEVVQHLRFGVGQGFFVEDEGGMTVDWPWLRAITRLLVRRHLLVSP